MSIRKIKSTFAILDVNCSPSSPLEAWFSRRPAFGPCPESLRIPVVIAGYLDNQYSRNDGTSAEFSVVVEDVKVGSSPSSAAQQPWPSSSSPPIGSRLVEHGPEVPLVKAPVGMFIASDDVLCMKTGYGSFRGYIDAFVVETGEPFLSDDPETAETQRAAIVQPVRLASPTSSSANPEVKP